MQLSSGAVWQLLAEDFSARDLRGLPAYSHHNMKS